MPALQVYVLSSGWERAALHLTLTAGRDTRILAILPDAPASRIIHSRLEDAARRIGLSGVEAVYLNTLNPLHAVHRVLRVLLEEGRPATRLYLNAAPHFTAEALLASLLAAASGVGVTIEAPTGDPQRHLVTLDLTPLPHVIHGLPESLERIARLVYTRPRTPDELVAETGLRPTTIAKRLSRLRAMRLVSKYRDRYAATPWLTVYAAMRGWEP